MQEKGKQYYQKEEVMKFLFWNIRGLGGKGPRWPLKELIS
jgi:hypothetical protein